MDGISTMDRRLKSKVFDRLVFALAIEAKLTAAVIMPPETEE